MIELRDVTYEYPDKTAAVENLSLKIIAGEKIAVLGGNGAGKSTLFLLLNGVYKVTRGEIYFKGEKINYGKNDLLKLRKSTGIVFQDPDTQIFSSSVYEDISFGLENLKYPENEIKTRVDEVLELLNIFHLKDKPTHLLSYGEKKKVSIAGILAMDPEILIMDEPDACLDPAAVKNLVRLLDNLHKTGKTILISTQDMNLAYAWANRIIVMKKGKILNDGLPSDIFLDLATIHEAALEMPLIFEITKSLKIQHKFMKGSAIKIKELIKFLKENISR
jgi:cobalt/nickel transport system ATP-binding protein